MKAYYNDNDPKICAWLRTLISGNLIAQGDVDDRSITEIQSEDLRGYNQVHLFAGIGGWSYALRLAGWTDDTPVWTGSCPCQPFSVAGKRKGKSDERHLWPEFRRLVAECRPPVVFGEQVASKLGRHWFDGVQTDLEALGYAVGAADLCAAGIGAPHIRQRLWWVADAGRRGDEHNREAGDILETSQRAQEKARQQRVWSDNRDGGAIGRLGNPPLKQVGISGQPRRRSEAGGRVGNLQHEGLEKRKIDQDGQGTLRQQGAPTVQAGPWSDFDWIPCADGKWRRIESGLLPVANGVSARVGRLRGYGNAIVPQVAAEFVKAYIGHYRAEGLKR